jgi:hypothetical protein
MPNTVPTNVDVPGAEAPIRSKIAGIVAVRSEAVENMRWRPMVEENESTRLYRAWCRRNKDVLPGKVGFLARFGRGRSAVLIRDRRISQLSSPTAGARSHCRSAIATLPKAAKNRRLTRNPTAGRGKGVREIGTLQWDAMRRSTTAYAQVRLRWQRAIQ